MILRDMSHAPQSPLDMLFAGTKKQKASRNSAMPQMASNVMSNPTDATCATRNFMTPQAANAFQKINPFKTGAPAVLPPAKKCNFQAPNVAGPCERSISSAGYGFKISSNRPGS